MEVHAVLMVRLVLCWGAPLGAPHPANVILGANGNIVLERLARDILHTKLDPTSFRTMSGRKSAAMLVMVVDSLYLCFRLSATQLMFRSRNAPLCDGVTAWVRAHMQPPHHRLEGLYKHIEPF